MALAGFITAGLLLASSACSTKLSESAEDQYKPREDESHPLLLPSESTDHLQTPQVEKLHRLRFMEKRFNGFANEQLAESDSAYGEGYSEDKHFYIETNEIEKARSKRFASFGITKRSYSPWQGVNVIQPPYESISVWKPPVYQLSRPYYVPIFGASGRVPIYYPPQPLYLNPGAPQDNPPVRPPFQGPTYLPPVTDVPPPETTMTVRNRFNNDDEDKPPVWDMVPIKPDAPPQVQPTRRPSRPSTSRPPLVRPTGTSQKNGTIVVSSPPPPPSFSKVKTTPAPPPGPSKCVWAIISCCSETSEIRYNCFEQMGCTGAFWDASPCDSQYAEAAIQAALNYYEK